MSPARRIERQPGCPYTRGDEIQIQFEGRSISGYSREPIAMALLAAGVRVFGRSIKYHRPRGPICLDVHCSGCLMRVDGIPNVRTCEAQCRSGQVVERQIGWPGSGRDMFRIMDWIYSTGLDHHGMFTSSGIANRMAMSLVRKMSGFGHPPTADLPDANSLNRFDAQVVVIGAGIAGLAASLAIAESGHPVILVESTDKIGGRMLDASSRLSIDQAPEQSGWQVREELKSRFEKNKDIELHQQTPAVAVYPGSDNPCVLAANERETLCIDTKRLVVTTGAYAQVPLFANNDLPGILTPRALDRMICGWGVVPAEPILLAGDSPDTHTLAAELVQRQVAVAGVVSKTTGGAAVEALEKLGIQVFPQRQIHRAHGGRWLNRVELSNVDGSEPDMVIDCGMLATEIPDAPAYELAHHAGCRVVFHSDSGYRVVTDDRGQTSDARIFSAGHCTGAHSASEAFLRGTLAGLACALSLAEDPAAQRRMDELIGQAGV